MISIDKVKVHPNNVKAHPESQIKNLIQLIKWVGFKDPLVLDKDHTIRAGHGRLIAARRLNMDKVPFIYLEGLTKKQMDLFVYMDNQINYSPWIKENVQILLEDVPTVDLETFDVEWKDIIPEKYQEETEPIPEPPEVPKAKVGEIYQLGNHRIMCGDSTDSNLIKKLMDKKAKIIYTDPPYGMKLDTDFSSMVAIGTGNKYKPVENDDRDYNPEHIFRDFGYCREIFLWGADYFSERIPDRNNGSWIVWDKTDEGRGPNSDYDKMFGSNFELCWSKVRHKRALARVLWKGIFGLQKEDTRKRLHPTHKPTELARWFFEKFSKENDIVADLFLGSGSTVIACEQTKRICYGMELDPAYIDVIIKRWENFTGEQAELLTN